MAATCHRIIHGKSNLVEIWSYPFNQGTTEWCCFLLCFPLFPKVESLDGRVYRCCQGSTVVEAIQDCPMGMMIMYWNYFQTCNLSSWSHRHLRLHTHSHKHRQIFACLTLSVVAGGMESSWSWSCTVWEMSDVHLSQSSNEKQIVKAEFNNGLLIHN